MYAWPPTLNRGSEYSVSFEPLFLLDEERDSSDILGNASIEISFITSNFCKEDNDTEGENQPFYMGFVK